MTASELKDAVLSDDTRVPVKWLIGVLAVVLAVGYWAYERDDRHAVERAAIVAHQAKEERKWMETLLTTKLDGVQMTLDLVRAEVREIKVDLERRIRDLETWRPSVEERLSNREDWEAVMREYRARDRGWKARSGGK